MYELTHKKGYKIIAYLKYGKWYDEQGYELDESQFVWCKKIKY